MKTEKASSFHHSKSFDKSENQLRISLDAVAIDRTTQEDLALKVKSKLVVDILNSTRKICDENIKEKFDMVWYALNRCRLYNHPATKRIEETLEYNVAIKELQGKDGDFQHGFNSGILATARLYRDYVSYDFNESIHWKKEKILDEISKKIEQSNNSFPNLEVAEFPTGICAFRFPNKCTTRQDLPTWNTIIIESLKKLEVCVRDKEKKAYDLVWFAQYRGRYPKHKDSKRIEHDTPEYSEKMLQLQGEDCDFWHGFNSGALAFSRLLLKIISLPKLSSKVRKCIQLPIILYFNAFTEFRCRLRPWKQWHLIMLRNFNRLNYHFLTFA